MLTPRPYQTRTVNTILERYRLGARRIVVQGPTGIGKTFTLGMLASAFLKMEKRVAWYTNRRMLLEQTSKALGGLDLDHGIRAAGHPDERWKAFQICSIQTEGLRVKNLHHEWRLHDADLVIVDEIHLNCGPTMQEIMARHLNEGALIVGPSATPIGIGAWFDETIVACTLQEARSYGAIVKAIIYGPDEPFIPKNKTIAASIDKGKDLSEVTNRKLMMNPTIYGRVYDWFNKINADHRPSLGFAPGVGESLGFAQEFTRRGINSAHVDGKNIWWNGDMYESTQQLRDDLAGSSRDGGTVCVFNRFVLREGIDWPWISHVILATIFGSLTTYLQSIGRELRGWQGKSHATVQDHGGNYWRHGSPNMDRIWPLDYTESMMAALMRDRMRTGKIPEPYRCPNCACIIQPGSVKICVCGHTPNYKVRARYVIQEDGEPKRMGGVIYKKRGISKDGFTKWRDMYYRFKNAKSDLNFFQAEACFAQENNWVWPDRQWPLMPREEYDFCRAVKNVPYERLIGGHTNGGNQ